MLRELHQDPDLDRDVGVRQPTTPQGDTDEALPKIASKGGKPNAKNHKTPKAPRRIQCATGVKMM
jgi:hypothetical protein